MPDPVVSKFKIQGRVSLWRYPKLGSDWEGWHFAADDEGIDSFRDLLNLMETAQYPSRTTLKLAAPPKAVLNVPNRETEEARPAKLWTLIYPREGVETNTWQLDDNASHPTLRFGTSYLPELRKFLDDSARGEGDYSIGSGNKSSEVLWAWWWVRGA